jgi:hypothetical protein
MSTIDVANAGDLQVALKMAGAGDTIRLAAGNYGDLQIASTNFASAVNIQSLDPTHPATFNTLTIQQSSGLTFQNIAVDMAATATTTTFSSAVYVQNSSAIAFSGGWFKAELSITGVAQDSPAAAADSSRNVLGLPTARAFTIDHSNGVTIDHADITQVFRGIVLVGSSNLQITNNNIHDIRTTPIAGQVSSQVTIDGNHLSNSRPWNWGTGGDHADFIHLWTDPAQQSSPTTNIVITNNLLDQSDGTSILGIYLDDNTNHIGFSNVSINNNTVMTGVSQGMRLENVSNSDVSNNLLLDAVGANRHAPGIVTDGSASTLNIHDNVTALVSNNPNSSAFLHDNTIVQDIKPAGAGYYTADLVTLARQLDPATAIQDVRQVLAGVDVHTFLAPSAGGPGVIPDIAPPLIQPPVMPELGLLEIHVLLPPGQILL